MQERESSGWKVVGVGCAGLILLVTLSFAAFLFVGQRMGQSVKAQMADTDLRRTKAEALLRTEALPAGYEATLSLSVPLLGRLAVLEQRSPEPVPGATRARGLFLYLESRGSSPPAEVGDERFRRLLEVRGLRLDPGQRVAGGELAIAAQVLDYRTIRGRLWHPPEGEREVLLALVDIKCQPLEEVSRLGVWIGADPAPGRPVDGLDLAGTPADPRALRAFLSTFRFCK